MTTRNWLRLIKTIALHIIAYMLVHAYYGDVELSTLHWVLAQLFVANVITIATMKLPNS